MVVSTASGDTAASKRTKNVQKKLTDHPTFKQMVLASIAALKQRKGSSRHAIANYIKEHYKVKDNFELHVRKAILKAITDGALIQASGIGASGSFKLAKVEKKSVSKVEKTTLVAKKSTKKSVASSKVKTAKKPASKTSKKKVLPSKPKKLANKTTVKKKVVKKSSAKKSNSKTNVRKLASNKSVGKKA